MKRIGKGVVFGALFALAFAGLTANAALWQEKDIPAWAKGTFSGRAEGWLWIDEPDESVWVDEYPTARVSLTVSGSGELKGEMKIGERTLNVSAAGIIAPSSDDVGEDGFIDTVKFSEPKVTCGNLSTDEEFEIELENMAKEYAGDDDDEGAKAPRARIMLNFSFGYDMYEVELFREFEDGEVPPAIKGLADDWVYDGESTNKWPIVVDNLGNATMSGKTDDGLEFEVNSKIIDYGLDTIPECYSNIGAYFNVPATEEHEGVDVWVGFNPNDASGDHVDFYTAFRDELTIMDDESRITIDDEDGSGCIIRPSGEMFVVEVVVPLRMNAENVTVEVSAKTPYVKSNDAKVRVFNENNDITSFINIPSPDDDGYIRLVDATVKDEYIKEVLDPKKGAVVELNAENSILKTAPTRAGLVYQLREGETLKGMKNGDSKVGDGTMWTPNITVKGGNSAFYSIGVSK